VVVCLEVLKVVTRVRIEVREGIAVVYQIYEGLELRGSHVQEFTTIRSAENNNKREEVKRCDVEESRIWFLRLEYDIVSIQP